MRWVMCGLHLIMAVLFGLSAAVQVNDPDPALWILIYVGAGLLCLQAAARRQWLNLAWAWGVGSLVTGVWMFQSQRPSFAMHVDNELFRELGGLMIICVWMGVVVIESAFLARAQRKAKASKAS